MPITDVRRHSLADRRESRSALATASLTGFIAVMETDRIRRLMNDPLLIRRVDVPGGLHVSELTHPQRLRGLVHVSG
jgi:hypothetical protein